MRSNVFCFDAFDGRTRALLGSVLARHGVDASIAFSRAPLVGGATFSILDEELVGRALAHDGKQVLPDDFKSARHYASGEFAGARANMGNVGTKKHDDRTDKSGKINRPVSMQRPFL